MPKNKKVERKRFAFASSTYAESEFVVFGVPDDSGSAYRKGSRYAPDMIRSFVNKNEIGGVITGSRFSMFEPGMKKFSSKVHDAGNLSRKELGLVGKSIRNRKVSIGLGGDHSITADILRAAKPGHKWGIAYFDAHPDIVNSRGRYFGSVVNDISKLEGFDPEASALIGIRTPEEEEIDNIKKLGIEVVTPQDIEERGARAVAESLRHILTADTYISIDMDVLDPAYAPGVTEPEPGGISSTQLIYLIDKIASERTFGVDITEVVPKFDKEGMTMHMAYRLILYSISAIDTAKRRQSI